MKCEKCGDEIDEGEGREHFGKNLCEDCYMDALSPARACDPWAVHSAKSFINKAGINVQLNPVQTKILDILRKSGGTEPEVLAEKVQIKLSDLEREIAALRHMEKVRGKLEQGNRIVLLW